MSSYTLPISLRGALPFALSLLTIPLIMVAAKLGGWFFLLVPAYFMVITSLLDETIGDNHKNADPETPTPRLFWYRAINMIWAPVQIATQFGLLWWVTQTDHLSTIAQVALFLNLGMLTGGIGIVYAHELIHQSNRFERWLGDILLASVLYSHFRTEHLQVHHRYVGTPRDPVTARYNEGFWRFFLRVLWQCHRSAWSAETERLAKKGLGPFNTQNPYWRYLALQALMLLAAFLIAGWWGLGLFVLQAFLAVLYLEAVNYVEHYGLTRKQLGSGKYEPVKPHHSWNGSQSASNWLLINLQRHSDHHYKPNRRFPLLQDYSPEEAPQLAYGYPLMTACAMIPPLWRRVMNPKVREWRRTYYPEITDWSASKNSPTIFNLK